jgi:outer membrane receptor protein involved in Fe transport
MGTDKHESARVILRIKPSRDFTNDFEYDYFHQNDQLPQQDYLVGVRNNYTYRLFNAIPLTINYAAYGITPNTGKTVRLDSLPIWNKAKINNYIDTATYDISDHATFKAVLGFQDLDLDTSQANNGSPATGPHGRTEHKIKKWTFEPSLDLKSEDGRLRNKTGLFFSDTKIDTGNSYMVFGFPIDRAVTPAGLVAAAANLAPGLSINFYKREFKSHAIYTQFSYDLTKELTATLGLRYTWDKATTRPPTEFRTPRLFWRQT